MPLPPPPRPHAGPDIATISSREVYSNAWLSIREDVIRRRDGTPGIFGVVDRPLGAVVIPRRVSDAGGEEFFLVNQFRYPVGARRWEFPAGTAPDSGDNHTANPLDVAERELREETGMRSDAMTVLTIMDVAPGFTSQRSAVVLAERLTEGTATPESEEQDLHGRWWSRGQIVEAIRVGDIVDAQTLAAWACLSALSGVPPRV